jgi:hypothetical protein
MGGAGIAVAGAADTALAAAGAADTVLAVPIVAGTRTVVERTRSAAIAVALLVVAIAAAWGAT